MKTCTMCGETKSLDSFYTSPKHTWCKACTKQRNREMKQENEENREIVGVLKTDYNSTYQEIVNKLY